MQTGSAIRHVQLFGQRWPVPFRSRAAQVRALHTSKSSSEKKVHFDKIDRLFVELGIGKELMQEVGGIRVRQHVNPLKKELQTPGQPLEWEQAYSDPTLPLVLDVGCGYGRFPLALSQVLPQHNLLGLEIRDQVVERAQRWAEGLGLAGRVRYARANATISLRHMLESYPGGLDLVTIQFPDPHFKRKHRKRRVVQEQLVRELAQLLRPGGRVFLQSDVEEVAASMRNEFEQYGSQHFQPSPLHQPGEVFYSQHAPGPSRELEFGASVPSSSSGAGRDSASTGVSSSSSSSGSSSSEGHSLGSSQPEAQKDAALAGSGASPALGAGMEGATGAASSGSDEEGSADGGGDLAGALEWLRGSSGAAAGDGGAAAAGAGVARQQWAWAAAGWLSENPLGVPTERELYTLEQGLPVYRVMLVRRDDAC